MAGFLPLETDIDPGGKVPVVATHSAYRFGKLAYNLVPEQIQRIARRNGVIGLIACDHYMTDGLGGRTATIEASMEILRRHIDGIKKVTGTYDNIAIGTDLDGFIKPTLKGLEFPAGFKAVRADLVNHYGEDAAEKIFRGNAMRLLSYWG